jgi:hypothetical protein
MAILLYFTAIVLSGIAAYYSVIGLTAIFAAAAIPVAIMGGSLEVAKLVVASWLYRFWRHIPILMRIYFTLALLILMLITSMGIFGYLSKAHLDQAVPTGDVVAQVALLDEKIKTQRDNIEFARRALAQMDATVDQTISRSTTEQGADKASTLRRSQARERAVLQKDIGIAQKEIAKLNEQRAPVAAELRKVEAEVGPIKYLAALIYGDNTDESQLERAVRWFIILLIFVFDPLAVLMLIAASLTQIKQREWKLNAEGNSPLVPSESLSDTVTVLKEVPNDTPIEVIPDKTELPVATVTTVEAETPKPDEVTTGPSVDATTEMAAVGKPVVSDPHPIGWMYPSAPVIPSKKQKKPKVKPVTEPVKVTEPVQEPAAQDKSFSEEEYFAASTEETIDKMIESGDQDSLESAYKKIVKELARKNRSKSTHWGSLKTK